MTNRVCSSTPTAAVDDLTAAGMELSESGCWCEGIALLQKKR